MSLFWTKRGQAEAPAGDESRGVFLPSQWFRGNSDDFSGVDVTQGETSLQSVAVRSTADLICSLASELPLHVYTGDAPEMVKRPVPSNLTDPGGDGSGREDWTYRLLLSWLLRGNAFGMDQTYDRRGRAVTVDLMHPDIVDVSVMDGKPVWSVSGKVLEAADERKLHHWRVNPVPGQVKGLSIIGMHAQTIGVSLSSGRFGAQWFRDGAHPSGLLQNTEVTLTADQAKSAKEKFVAAMSGNREPLVLGKGWDFNAIQVSPEESQFLETQGFTEAQCARMFGPGFAEIMGYSSSGGTLTYTNVVDRRQDLLVLSMNKWLRRIERVLSTLVPPQQYVVLNRDALLEATTITRYQAHASALQHQWRTVNEVRSLENLPPVPWGNEPLVGATASPSTPGESDGNS